LLGSSTISSGTLNVSWATQFDNANLPARATDAPTEPKPHRSSLRLPGCLSSRFNLSPRRANEHPDPQFLPLPEPMMEELRRLEQAKMHVIAGFLYATGLKYKSVRVVHVLSGLEVSAMPTVGPNRFRNIASASSPPSPAPHQPH
jgi:hypothetical protein